MKKTYDLALKKSINWTFHFMMVKLQIQSIEGAG